MDEILILFCTDSLFFFHSLNQEGLLIPCEYFALQGWEPLYDYGVSEEKRVGRGGFLQRAGSELSISLISAFRTAKLAMHPGAIFGKRLCDLSS